MIDFLNNKAEFLENFSKGSYTITPISIGFVFSFVQKDMKDKIDLFRSLKRIKLEVPDQNQVCYAVIKALKSAEFYIDSYQNEEFLDLYCEITAAIGMMRIPKSLETKIQNLFCQNWSKLARKYAKTENFYKIFLLGKRNIRLFYRTPLVLNAENEAWMKKLVQVKEEPDSETLMSVFQLFRTLRPASNEEDCNVLRDFLAFKIRYLFSKTQSLEFVHELKRKIEENINCFDEQTISELKNAYSARVSGKAQAREVQASQAIPKAKIDLNQSQGKDPVEFYNNKQGPIKIPVKNYQGQKIQSRPSPQRYQNKPQGRPAYFNKADEAPNEINSNSKEIEENIKDAIQACLRKSSNEEIDQTAIRSIFKEYEKYEITFPNLLHKVLKETIERSYNEESFAAWDTIIEISKEFLTRLELVEIVALVNGKNAEESKRNQVRGNFVGAGPDRQPSGEAASNPAYLHSGWSEVKQKDESKVQGSESFDQSALRDREEGGEQEFRYQAQESDFRFENKAGEIVGQVDQPEPGGQAKHENPNPADSASCCGYFKVISITCKDFIDCFMSQTADIARINTPLIRFKSLLQENSPSAKLNLIGSAYTGTYIKGTEVDVNFYDIHQIDPASLLKLGLSSLKLELKGEQQNRLYFSSGEATYIIHMNLDLHYETSTLIKTYCNLDSRCKELITLVKYWARRAQVYGRILSGYHISLLCITFLQLCSPPILPSLQSQVHTPELIGEVDVWFDKSLEFFSLNTSTLGEILIYFFAFIQHYSFGYTCYPSIGQIAPNETGKVLSCCNLFGNTEVSTVLKSSEEGQKLIEVVKETVFLINSSEDLYKIMRI